MSFTVNTAIGAGTVIEFAGSLGASGNGTFGGSVINALASSGDQIVVFQDTDGPGGSDPEDNPSFIHILNGASRDITNGCDHNDLNETNSPPSLTPVTFGGSTGTFLALGAGTGCDTENDHIYYSNGTISFASTAAAKSAIQDPDNFTGATGTNPPGAYTTAKNNIINAANLLPVELIYFSAQEKDGAVQLNWSTAAEIENKGFEIERSENGIQFSSIDFVDGQGTTTITQNYSYEDQSINSGTTYYYRLKQIDFDGDMEYSNVVTILIGTPLEQLSIYPNPNISGPVNLQFLSPVSNPAQIKVIDLSGRIVWSQSINPFKGDNHLSLDFSNLSAGLYTVKLEQGKVLLSQRLVIE